MPNLLQAQFNYTLNPDSTVVITKYTGPGGDVTIPATINVWPVTTIGTAAFQSCSNLTSITFPDSVTSIGDNAFATCASLKNITFGNGVKTIGFEAFAWCTQLTQVSMPDSVVSLGDEAFGACHNLASFATGNGLIDLRSSLLGCYNLTNIEIGSSVATFPQGLGLPLVTISVASNNPYLSTVDGVLFNKDQSTLVLCPVSRGGTYAIPDTVTSVAPFAFANCSSLTSVSIPTGVTDIGKSSFKGCSALLSLIIPNNVTNIEAAAFEQCSSLASLSIGESVVSIGDYAFQYCTSLTSVKIPDSVTTLGNAAFALCPGLTDLTLSKNLTDVGQQVFAFCSNLPSVVIPNRYLGIAEFQACGSLTNVTIGPNMTYIDGNAFLDCVNLTAVYFQGNAPGVDPTAFENDGITIIYYVPGTTGWGNVFAGRPVLPVSTQIQTGGASFGVSANQFWFNIPGSNGPTFVVEAATNLVKPTWYPLQTNTLNGTSVYFSDPQWTNYPNRFYRVRWP